MTRVFGGIRSLTLARSDGSGSVACVWTGALWGKSDWHVRPECYSPAANFDSGVSVALDSEDFVAGELENELAACVEYGVGFAVSVDVDAFALSAC